MTMLVKNATILRFAGVTQAEVETAAAGKPFLECGASTVSSVGFVPPSSLHPESLFRSVGKLTLVTVRLDEKLLPACVVKAETAKCVETIEENEGRKLGRKETKEVKERVTQELLAKAFIRTTLIHAWFDFEGGLLVVNAATPGKVDVVLNALRRTDLWSHEGKLRSWKTNSSPDACFTAWASEGDAPEHFSIDKSALFEDITGGKVRVSGHDVSGEQFKQLFIGNSISELAMTYNERMSFVMTEKLVIKRIAFLDIIKVREEQGDLMEDARDDAELILSAGEIRKVYGLLAEAFGGNMDDMDGSDEAQAAPADTQDTEAAYAEAKAIVVEAGRASISTVQRKLQIGYNYAARLIERMESDGIVSAPDAKGARTVVATATVA
jgi:recombination associated protein RdgC